MRCKLAGRISLLAFSLLTPLRVTAGPLDVVPEQTCDGITYIEGGIGTTEERAFAEAAKDYPLVLEFVMKHRPHAAFINDVHIILMDTQGQALLDTISHGPFLLATLSPGHYIVRAMLGGQTLTQSVRVTRGKSAHVLFLWSG